MGMIKRFWSDRSGNYAILAAVAAVPLLLSVGLATDYSRYVSAQKHLQELADAAALAMAATDETKKRKLRELANDVISSNRSNSRIEKVKIAGLKAKKDWVDLSLEGSIPTTFMSLAKINQLDVRASALAERAITGSVEVALVLDNTWSMSMEDGNGNKKIDTLKTAASDLVDELMGGEESAVRVALVPYADYVNVGTQHRNASWLEVPDNYDVKGVAAECENVTVTGPICVEWTPKYSCTKYVDGVPEAGQCGGGECTRKETRTYEDKQCTGGVRAASYRWYGCVGSRMPGDTRLHDGSPADRYPGYLDESQKCLNPIVPLTDNESRLKNAVDDMIINIGGYKPRTYIPAGLIWGQNVLSPTEPFSEAGAYDPDNKAPRKVVVLMTDGENYMTFRRSDGRHIVVDYPSGFDPNDPFDVAAREEQMKPTNDDTVAICNYMKTHNIEIFTVAFMVEFDFAKQVLLDCATSSEHYYDASDPEKLMAAFEGIGRSLRQVRLAR